jgi:hypothetical protein
MDIDRLLYWFLTREPGTKLMIAAAFLVTFFLFCLLILSAVSSLL